MNFEFLRDRPVDLPRYLPKFLHEDNDLAAILKSTGAEHERQRLLLQDAARQCFVETATWGLSDFERVLDLHPGAGNTDATRRERILLKLRGRQVSTRAFMERLAAYYFPQTAKVQIEEHNEKNLFFLLSDAVCTNYTGLIDAIGTYKPAHLAFAVNHRLERHMAVYAGGYVVDFERIKIESGGEVTYEMQPAAVYAAGCVNGVEHIEVGGV